MRVGAEPPASIDERGFGVGVAVPQMINVGILSEKLWTGPSRLPINARYQLIIAVNVPGCDQASW
jgi:hypothetical protein